MEGTDRQFGGHFFLSTQLLPIGEINPTNDNEQAYT
jgi:hypothetical protein